MTTPARLPAKLLTELRVLPGQPADLAHRSTAATTTEWSGAAARHHRHLAQADLASFNAALTTAQERLWANGTQALLIIFQALDAAGKDGTIKHVMAGVNPQGCAVHSFKEPTPTEAAHNFLWRASAALPAKGMIGIFNRSYYEDVLVPFVHPELLPDPSPATLTGRYEDIVAFERHLTRNSTTVLKLFLHVSAQTQRQRFLDRLDDPAKLYKFSPADLTERAYYSQYQQAYEAAVTATSTKDAPWYLIPADHKSAMRALAAGIIVHTIDQMDLSLPAPTPAQLEAARAARAALLAEPD
jgi:PPK2 family polyphosphate:nucleotide phosphotransferase